MEKNSDEDKTMKQEICDVSAIQECFKKYPTQRMLYCAKELEEYRKACAQSAEKAKLKEEKKKKI
jgi:hypothetical protein